MKYLQFLKKDKLGMLLFSVFTAILVILLLKRSFLVVYNYFTNGDTGLWIGDFGQSLIILIFGLPTILMYDLPKLIEYIGILVDIKRSKTIKEIVVPYNTPQLTIANRHKSGTKKVDDSYYIWKVKNGNNKKMKMIFFDEVFSFTGKTIGHKYEVTYYKHSKVIVDVKKIS